MALRETYTLLLKSEGEGGFSVIVPALSKVHTQGETVDDTIANTGEVIALTLEVRCELGEGDSA